MDFLYFLLKDSPWVSGESWDMPHSLWYESNNGFALGIILAIAISLVVCSVYYQLFPRIFKNIPMSRLNWLLFLVINIVVVLFSCFFVAKSGIIDYATANGYIDEAPAMLNVLTSGTLDMWMFGIQNAIYSIVLFFALSFICRLKSRGFNIPF
ncbi:hypothetical protein [Dysgonomonas sp. 520]|uniref:hypothetical protein n=1 Tax=Dysgonomonas sp. 520 TaxID=2302931 RepID=UPI0013D286FF|nr:hypothetical protein [Dysgonomonas sp. 520]NDW11062.1 hypothetical protein [Dysgonomonas sp. 520]